MFQIKNSFLFGTDLRKNPLAAATTVWLLLSPWSRRGSCLPVMNVGGEGGYKHIFLGELVRIYAYCTLIRGHANVQAEFVEASAIHISCIPSRLSAQYRWTAGPGTGEGPTPPWGVVLSQGGSHQGMNIRWISLGLGYCSL